MLFLMNDVVLNLDALDLAPPVAARRFAKLNLPFVSALGAELFSEEPLLPHVSPERAMRLAMLIVARRRRSTPPCSWLRPGVAPSTRSRPATPSSASRSWACSTNASSGAP